jgi:hypothetical protein
MTTEMTESFMNGTNSKLTNKITVIMVNCRREFEPQSEVYTNGHSVQKYEMVALEKGSNGNGQLELVNMSSTEASGGIKFSQPHKSCWNDSAPKNMDEASTKLDTFHCDKSWLNEVAPANCNPMYKYSESSVKMREV